MSRGEAASFVNARPAMVCLLSEGKGERDESAVE
jgi:hypothetical protein